MRIDPNRYIMVHPHTAESLDNFADFIDAKLKKSANPDATSVRNQEDVRKTLSNLQGDLRLHPLTLST